MFYEEAKDEFWFDRVQKFQQFFWNAGNHAEQEGGYTFRVSSHKKLQGMG